MGGREVAANRVFMIAIQPCTVKSRFLIRFIVNRPSDIFHDRRKERKEFLGLLISLIKKNLNRNRLGLLELIKLTQTQGELEKKQKKR